MSDIASSAVVKVVLYGSENVHYQWQGEHAPALNSPVVAPGPRLPVVIVGSIRLVNQGLVCNAVSTFRQFHPIRVISMHGKPLLVSGMGVGHQRYLGG